MSNVITIENNAAQALKFLLSLRQLTFGDSNQIQAVSLVRMAEDLLDCNSARKCSECDGTGKVQHGIGYCDCCGRRCDHCDGKEETCESCYGAKYVYRSRDEVYALPGTRLWELLEQHKAESPAA